MPDLGPHAHFIWLAYGAVALVLAALILWLRADLAAQRRQLAMLEARKPAAIQKRKTPVAARRKLRKAGKGRKR